MITDTNRGMPSISGPTIAPAPPSSEPEAVELIPGLFPVDEQGRPVMTAGPDTAVVPLSVGEPASAGRVPGGATWPDAPMDDVDPALDEPEPAPAPKPEPAPAKGAGFPAMAGLIIAVVVITTAFILVNVVTGVRSAGISFGSDAWDSGALAERLEEYSRTHSDIEAVPTERRNAAPNAAEFIDDRLALMPIRGYDIIGDDRNDVFGTPGGAEPGDLVVAVAGNTACSPNRIEIVVSRTAVTANVVGIDPSAIAGAPPRTHNAAGTPVCTAIPDRLDRTHLLVIDLGSELGNRALIDGSTGKAAPAATN